MSITIEDLKPKNFTIHIDGLELECKPPRLSQMLTMTKVGGLFNDLKNASLKDIKEAETSMDEVVGELIPELKGIGLDAKKTMDIISQIMDNVAPSDIDYLEKNGVQVDENPKVGKAG